MFNERYDVRMRKYFSSKRETNITSYRFPNTCDEFPLGAYDEFEYSWISRIKQEFKRMNPSEFQWIRVMLRVRADRSNKRLPSRFHLILDLNPEF